MKKILTNILFVVVFFSMVNFTYASSITSTKINKNQPLNITSNKVKIIRNKGEIIFIGDVIATQDEFTLYADTKKGNRPSYINSMKANEANNLYNLFNEELKKYNLNIQTGIFQADMLVNINNDGPVTIILES